MSSTIVVPLDGSPAAESAIPFAILLARRSNAPLMLTSVVAVSGEFASWLNTGVDQSDSEIGAWVEDRRIYLTSLIDALEGDDVHAHVSVGRPTNMLIEFIDSVENPIVVIASHGEAVPDEGSAGRHTFRLIHHLACPMVIVPTRSDGGTQSMPDVTRVVLPLDGSEFSEAALTATTSILGELSPSLHLVHVIDNESAGSRIARQGLVGDYLEAAREERSTHLQEIAETLTGRGFITTWEVREGPPAEQIALAATEANASMIAMPTHGRDGGAQTLLGSTAEAVLHISRLPLLLVHPNEDRG
ncbi:MAG: universal stress protein [Chloroflexia bacterium]|nr:universal stress protein [Chloroflexia bacterium]